MSDPCERYELFGELLLVRVLTPGNRTRGGLIIPESALDNTPWQNAEIMAASKGWYNADGRFLDMPVKRGDLVVFFRKQAGQIVFPVGNEDMLLIRFTDVGMRLTGLDKVTSIVGVDGGNLELPS